VIQTVNNKLEEAASVSVKQCQEHLNTQNITETVFTVITNI